MDLNPNPEFSRVLAAARLKWHRQWWDGYVWYWVTVDELITCVFGDWPSPTSRTSDFWSWLCTVVPGATERGAKWRDVTPHEYIAIRSDAVGADRAKSSLAS